MLLSDFIRKSCATLEALYPYEEARSIVSILCEEVLGLKSYHHIIEPEYELPAQALPQLLDSLGRLAKGEPIQYVLGFSEFYGRKFWLNSSVLIPRPETELLVETALSLLDNGQKVLELCTGSGCIAWSIALEKPGTELVACDISNEALAVASSQFSELPAGVKSPRFLLSDVLRGCSEIEGETFDLLLANPPYIREKERSLMRPNVLCYEPELALFVPDNDPLLFYKAIARIARRLLKDSGVGIVEINEELGSFTAEVFIKEGYKEIEILRDFSKKERFVKFSSSHQ